MEEFIELLKIVLPSVVVFLTAFFLIKNYLEAQTRRQMAEFKMEMQKAVQPVRLQAYERVILFLERISPNSIVMRTYKPGMSAKLLQSEIMRNIREEYEHNMTQQMYVSGNTWLLLRNAKEEIVRMVNVAASKLPHDASGIDLSQAIFEEMAKLEKIPTEVAITFTKNEVQKIYMAG